MPRFCRDACLHRCLPCCLTREAPYRPGDEVAGERVLQDDGRWRQSAIAAAHPNDYELRTAGTQREEDVEGQIRLVEEMIGQKVDALVIAPADSKALIPVCKRAADAGITVVNIDNKFDAATLKSKGLTTPFVGPDNRKGAKMAGDYLANKLQKGDEVIIIEGLPTAYQCAAAARPGLRMPSRSMA